MPDKLMTLEEIRERLDLGDTQMLEWLAIRARLVREVARIKEARGASLQAADREASMFARKQVQCRVLGLDFDYVSELVSLMIWHSKQIECEELGRETFLNTEPVPEETLRSNLLALTEAEAARYDEYCRGEDAETISAYLDRELQWIDRAIAAAPGRDVALDLGCATGHVAEHLEGHFRSVWAWDISPHMIEQARTRRAWGDGVRLEVRDLDLGIPVGDGSVDLAVANFGAASELHAGLMGELRRVLRPGGVALLSWYNREALVNHWIYPWPSTIHSHLNPWNDTLEVWSGDSVYTIRARGEDGASVRARAETAGLLADVGETYPTLQPIVPSFITHNPRARRVYEICRDLDHHLSGPGVGHGSYIITTVRRPAGD